MLSSSINLQWLPFIQRAASNILTDYGPFVFGNRPVRTRTPGGVGAGGENPPATRLDDFSLKFNWLRSFPLCLFIFRYQEVNNFSFICLWFKQLPKGIICLVTIRICGIIEIFG